MMIPPFFLGIERAPMGGNAVDGCLLYLRVSTAMPLVSLVQTRDLVADQGHYRSGVR